MEPPPPRPKLNLKLSFSPANGSSNTPQSQPDTPSAQAPLRTPSIKLNFKPKPSPGAATSTPATPNENGATPTGSTKKRKRPGAEPDSTPGSLKIKGPQMLKLITKGGLPSTAKNSAITPGIKLKTKGKIPKRSQGVGYDSELEDRELDPVILEAFVLRMLPGDDCNYISDAIANGTVGVSILQKGADIRMRVLDIYGRRGILTVRGTMYAFTIVDLPTITEGMKSWDKKNFIKSVDISQMCLVLGPCKNDQEAREYPLPPDVDPKNYQYAHGLTAPMRNVRKRRFERTARARLDDIEAIERKVQSLLDADVKATTVTCEVLDHDPRAEEDEFSGDEYDSEEDAEGEVEDGYFPDPDNLVATPGGTHVAPEEITTEEMSALEAMFEQADQEGTAEVTDATAIPGGGAAITLQHAVDANSSSATSSAARTTGEAETPAAAEEEDDDDAPDADDDADDDASDQEASNEREEVRVKIRENEEKIRRHRDSLRATTNQILRKKIAKKIQDLESDKRMMQRQIGMVDNGDRDEDGEGTVAVGGGAGTGGNVGGDESGSEEE